MNPRPPREREEEGEEEGVGGDGKTGRRRGKRGGGMPKGGKWKKELHACAARSRGAGGAVEALRVGGPGEFAEAGATGCTGRHLVGGGSGAGVFAEAPGERHGPPDGTLLPIGGSARKLRSTVCHMPLYHLAMGLTTP